MASRTRQTLHTPNAQHRIGGNDHAPVVAHVQLDGLPGAPTARVADDSRERIATSVRATPTLWFRGPLSRYALAVAAPAVALGLSLLLDPYLDRIVFMLFWPAVLITAVFAGLVPRVTPNGPAILPPSKKL